MGDFLQRSGNGLWLAFRALTQLPKQPALLLFPALLVAAGLLLGWTTVGQQWTELSVQDRQSVVTSLTGGEPDPFADPASVVNAQPVPAQSTGPGFGAIVSWVDGVALVAYLLVASTLIQFWVALAIRRDVAPPRGLLAALGLTLVRIPSAAVWTLYRLVLDVLQGLSSAVTGLFGIFGLIADEAADAAIDGSLFLVPPYMAVEGRGPAGAMNQSRRSMSGRWLEVWGLGIGASLLTLPAVIPGAMLIVSAFDGVARTGRLGGGFALGLALVLTGLLAHSLATAIVRADTYWAVATLAEGAPDGAPGWTPGLERDAA